VPLSQRLKNDPTHNRPIPRGAPDNVSFSPDLKKSAKVFPTFAMFRNKAQCSNLIRYKGSGEFHDYASRLNKFPKSTVQRQYYLCHVRRIYGLPL
jgi:hypothetical protein